MSPRVLRRTHLLIPLVLAILAGCQDSTGPTPFPGPQFAQGDAGTWTVNSLADPGDGTCDDAHCTLREAIAAAASGDRIEFADGLQGSILMSAGPFGIGGKDLTIDGGGVIALDAQQNSAVILVNEATDPLAVTLVGLSFINGVSTSSSGGSGGVNVYGPQVQLTLDHVVVSDNVTDALPYNSGGGIQVLGGATVSIRSSTITRNTSTLDGGAIYVSEESSLTLVNSTVDANSADRYGGGIYSDGHIEVIATTISDNDAANGGGIFNAGGASAEVVRSTISSNRALEPDFSAGGIYNASTLALRSATVTRNSASGYMSGGGLRNLGPATFMNSILVGNTGTDGAINNCVVSTGSPMITSFGYNVVSGCFANEPTDVQTTVAQAFTHVLEPDLADNGGPTRTHALLVRGLAVDAGYCPGETSDQRGFTRPVDDPIMPDALDACDIGAYELQGPLAAVADLMVSQAVDKTSVKQGELLTYFIRVQNLGPQSAPDVVVNNLLSSGVTFVEVRVNKGTTTAPPKGETGTVTWVLGEMLSGADEVAEIAVTVLVRGKTTITNTATVAGDVADPNEANNTAAITVSVAAGSTGGSGGTTGGNGNGGGPKK